jgi:hypothetical protein
MKKSARQLDKEIAQALRRPSGHARKRKPKTPHEIRTSRLKTLQGIMEDVYGGDDQGWPDIDLEKLEGWIDVNDDLSDREWLDAAKNQLVEQSVRAEHVGAPPERVYLWNDVFISTYRMNIDQGMDRGDAIDSARQNAFDTVVLSPGDRAMIKTDPKLYGDD